MRKIILASAFPRRKVLLANMGDGFTVTPSNFAEHLDDNCSPEKVAKELARGKTMTVARKHPDAIVIGVDIVKVGESILYP